MTGLRPDGLHHLITPGEWARLGVSDSIEPPSLEAEGFVHCSWGHQVPGTLERHFADVDEVLALRIDPERLGDVPLVEEDSYGSGRAFPHLYGPLPVAAVLEAIRVKPAG